MIVDELIAGDTLDFYDTAADYPASDGWVLKYRLVPEFTSPVQAPVTLTASTYQTNDYRVQETAAATALWAAGMYSWGRWVELGTIRVGLGTGRLKVLPDPATAVAGTDRRSHARRTLEAIEAVIERRATLDQQKYSLEGRSLERTPVADLLVLRDKYRAEVKNEEQAAKLAAGLGNPRNIGIRFGRA